MILTEEQKSKLSRDYEKNPLKRQTAKQNNLNWMEFFTIKEIENWLKQRGVNDNM